MNHEEKELLHEKLMRHDTEIINDNAIQMKVYKMFCSVAESMSLFKMSKTKRESVFELCSIFDK